jgi:large subunit ribosomal protein L10e
MAKLRRAAAYRTIKRAFTRTSKYKSKSYIKGVPMRKVTLYDMGALNQTFPVTVKLFAKKPCNLRHNAIESGRMVANRVLASNFGKKGYSLHLHTFPHNILRENALATGAGADRFQTGMKHSFGKPVGTSAHIKKGKLLITARVPENGEKTAREALRKASSKFPIPCSIEAVIA